MGKDSSSFASGPGGRGRSATLARAFRALPPAHREILTETVFRRRSVDQAADALGVPVAEVKIRVHQALHALRAALERPWPTAG